MLPGTFRWLLLLLLGVILLSACDSDQRAANEAARVVFAANEHQKVFGNYTLHVNALTTDQLSSDVAREYGIGRSKSKAMLNVVITKNEDGEPVTATVSTVARNLTNQIKDMKMLEILAGDAIYYIGVLSVDNEETIVFDVDVTPVSESQPFLITYRKRFFTE